MEFFREFPVGQDEVLIVLIALIAILLIIIISYIIGSWQTQVSPETSTEFDNSDLGIVDPATIMTEKRLVREIFFASHMSDDDKFADRCIALLRRKPELVNFRLEPSGYTPFLDACWAGSHKLVEYMLQHGAKTDSTADEGNTPMYLATFSYAKKSADFNPALLQALVNFKCSINQPKGSGHTPLHLAAKMGCFELVRWLLVNKADAEAITSNGRTAADVARDSGHQKIATFLTVQCDTGNVVLTGGSSRGTSEHRVCSSSLPSRRPHLAKFPSQADKMQRATYE